MQRLRPLTLLAALLPLAAADVKFTSPAPGTTLAGGGALSIGWTDSGSAPPIMDLQNYQLFICAGGNKEGEFIQLDTITTNGVFANGNQAGGSIAAGIGSSDYPNAYFLKIISSGPGGTVTNYSPRFSISGMTGTFPPNVISGIKAIEGSLDGPDSVIGAVAATKVDGDVFGVLYGQQTGPTKYAPMQIKPPSKITKKATQPVNPPSNVPMAVTFMPPPSAGQTTITQSPSWSVSMRENTGAGMARATDDMQKFLRRWVD